MANTNKFEKELEKPTDWRRIRAGATGGFVGWLLSIPTVAPIFFLLRSEDSDWWNRIVQILLAVVVVLFCRSGIVYGMNRYDKRNEK